MASRTFRVRHRPQDRPIRNHHLTRVKPQLGEVLRLLSLWNNCPLWTGGGVFYKVSHLFGMVSRV